jgi:hypothetical protein
VLRNVRAGEPARAQANIQLLVGLEKAIRKHGKSLSDGPGQTVGQAKRHELDGFRRIEVRQVTARVPAFVVHVSMSRPEAGGPED